MPAQKEATKEARTLALKGTAKAKAGKQAKALENKAMARGQALSLETATTVERMDTRPWTAHSQGKAEDSIW